MRNSEYWERRAISALTSSELSVLDYEQKLKEAYQIALREIKKDIDAFFNRYAKEHKISYTEARKRLSVTELSEFKAFIKNWLQVAKQEGWSKEYIRYLEDLVNSKYISRLEMLEADVRHQIELIENNKYVQMTELMSINYMSSYYDKSYTLAHGTEVAVRFNAVTKAGVEKAVKTKWSQYTYSEVIWNDRDKLTHALSTIIPQSFSRGLNSNKLGEMIAKEMNASLHRGRTLARTEVNYICNQADLDAYKVIGIEEYDYLATLDMRTSEICRSLDGTTHKVSQAKVGVNFPPMHPNCRSTTVAHFEEDEEGFEERVARDDNGKTIRVPRRMTQEEYINTYVPEEDREKLLEFRKKFYKNM